MFVFKSKYEDVVNDLASLEVYADRLSAENARLREAHAKILANETKAPNATVTRVLNISKSALGLK